MFGSSGFGVVFQSVIFCLIIIEGSLSLARRIPHYQKECYNREAILNCPNFRKAYKGKLLWRYKDKTTNDWVEIASIKHGNSKVTFANTALDGRLNIHSNGSLEISSLQPDDETHYQCIVKQASRKLHVIELSVSCGKVSKIERKVCVEKDVALECEAKHRTNPMKLKDIKWHKILKVSGDSVWLLIVPSNDSSSKIDGGGLRLHENGSLILPQGREESEDTYKCDAIKKGNARLDRHIIVVKNVKCREEKIQTAIPKKITITTIPSLIKGTDDSRKTSTAAIDSATSSGNIKTTQGRGAMTTAIPIKGTEVPMGTRTSFSSNQTSKASTSAIDPATSSGNIKTTQGRGAMTTAIPIKGTEVPMGTRTSFSSNQTSKASTSAIDPATSSGNVKTTQGRGAMTSAIPIKGTEVPMETSMTSTDSSTKSNDKTALTNPTQSAIACGGVMRNPVGAFQSPNFPSAYPANSHCKWTISVPQTYAAIDITFDRLHLEHDDNCGSDYITIQDELHNNVGCRLCGIYTHSVKIQVRGKIAVILFQSDNSVQKKGFRLSYRGVKIVTDPNL